VLNGKPLTLLDNRIKHIYELLEQVADPEIPVLTILDLGIVRDVVIHPDNIEIIITPTYSGCPAMDAIAVDIKMKLIESGYKQVKVSYTLSPAWTTDWMTEEGKRKLKEYGIAPPQQLSGEKNNSRLNALLFEEEQHIECPQCHSTNTKLLSQFGSTACKALYQCNSCKETFDYFKCH
jgi:ring-1,2-phenylacetyl-CoA epoxidase subunit PaaD